MKNFDNRIYLNNRLYLNNRIYHNNTIPYTGYQSVYTNYYVFYTLDYWKSFIYSFMGLFVESHVRFTTVPFKLLTRSRRTIDIFIIIFKNSFLMEYSKFSRNSDNLNFVLSSNQRTLVLYQLENQRSLLSIIRDLCS